MVGHGFQLVGGDAADAQGLGERSAAGKRSVVVGRCGVHQFPHVDLAG